MLAPAPPEDYRQIGSAETLFPTLVSFFRAVWRHDNEHVHAPPELRVSGGTNMTVNIRDSLLRAKQSNPVCSNWIVLLAIKKSGDFLRDVIASQRVRPEVAGPMTSSAKQSRVIAL
jgi:hypothetical protein